MKAEMERICNIPNLAGLAPDAERCFETKSIAQVNLRTPSSPTERARKRVWSRFERVMMRCLTLYIAQDFLQPLAFITP